MRAHHNGSPGSLMSLAQRLKKRLSFSSRPNANDAAETSPPSPAVESPLESEKAAATNRISGVTRSAQHDWTVEAEEQAMRASLAAARASLALSWDEEDHVVGHVRIEGDEEDLSTPKG